MLGKLMIGLWIMLHCAHYRVKHCNNEFANDRNHINGLLNFCGYCKTRMTKFRGSKRENFIFHLKECGFWYYTKIANGNLYQILLKLIRENQRSGGKWNETGFCENPIKFRWTNLNRFLSYNFLLNCSTIFAAVSFICYLRFHQKPP